MNESKLPVDHKRLALTERDRRLIDLISRFRLVSRDQAMALAPFGSLTRANTRLAALTRGRLLSRKTLPVYPGKGGAQALYFLGHEGAALLGGELTDFFGQIRQIRRWDSRQAMHVVAANQVLVDFIIALQQTTDAALLGFRTEPELRQVFRDKRLVPDGWIAWTERGRRFNCFVEVDLHSEGLAEWRKKVLAYLEYAESGSHGELFGFGAFRVLVVAKSKTRLQSIQRIAQQVGRLFLFAEIGNVDAQNILGQTWLPATGEQLIALSEA